MKPPVIAIVGATATGKTALAEAVAEALDGELVCADSRQVYRELETGTGKPTPEQRARRPHHLFEALELDRRASAGAWVRAAAETCGAIRERGRTPVLVGGSGLYLRALQHGIASEPPHDAALRARLADEVRSVGVAAMHQRLQQVDPVIAARVAATDTQRVTRALEVWMASGHPLSWWQRERPGGALPAEWRTVELTHEPVRLAERIAARTHDMFEHGLIEETHALLDRGRGEALQALRAVGYDEALELLRGTIDRGEAEARTNRRTRQLAKRQRTWFRHQMETVRLDVGEHRADELVARALALVGPRE